MAMSRHSARLSHTRQSAARSRQARIGESLTLGLPLRRAVEAMLEFRLNATAQPKPAQGQVPGSGPWNAHRSPDASGF